jgi:hypothetical protein
VGLALEEEKKKMKNQARTDVSVPRLDQAGNKLEKRRLSGEKRRSWFPDRVELNRCQRSRSYYIFFICFNIFIYMFNILNPKR